MSRTSGARFPDPPEGSDEPKRYRVTLVIVQELTFDVDGIDEDDAEENARLLYRHGQDATVTGARYIEDVGMSEIEDES